MITWNSYLMTLGLNFILIFIFAMISICFSAKIYPALKQSKFLWVILCVLGSAICSFANMNTSIDFFYLITSIVFILAYFVLLGAKHFYLNIFLVSAYMLNIMTLRMCISCIAALITGQSLFEISYSNSHTSELCIIITLLVLITAMFIMMKIIPGNAVYRITQIPALRRGMNIWMGLSNVYLLSQSLGYSSIENSGLSLLRNFMLISILLLFANWAFLFYNLRIIKLLEFEYENRKMHVQMQELNQAATTDGLTGLLNKTSTIKEIDSLIFQGGAMFVIDIDDFKSVNDTKGHTNGDLLLCQVAKAIELLFRSDDILGRFGGDEFVIFVPHENISETIIAPKAEELHRKTKEKTGASISIGILLIPNSRIKSFEDAFPLADRALYESKRKGKNTYTIHKM